MTELATAISLIIPKLRLPAASSSERYRASNSSSSRFPGKRKKTNVMPDKRYDMPRVYCEGTHEAARV